MTPKTTKKAVVYCRFSPRPKEDEEKTESIQTQNSYCERYIASKGWEHIVTFYDIGKSGADFKRPGLMAAINLLRRGYVLVVYKFDRLARSAYIAHYVEHHALAVGASIASATNEGTIAKSMPAEEQLVINILHDVADYTRKINNYRTSMAMLWHQRNGHAMSKQLPYGKMLDESNPRDDKGYLRMIDNPKEQKIIKKIMDWYNEGKSRLWTSRELMKTGVTCRGNARWHPGTVDNIIKRQLTRG